jgi:hypothetical protein
LWVMRVADGGARRPGAGAAMRVVLLEVNHRSLGPSHTDLQTPNASHLACWCSLVFLYNKVGLNMPRHKSSATRTGRMEQVDELQCKENRDNPLVAGSPRLCCRGLSPTFLTLCALLWMPSASGASNRR